MSQDQQPTVAEVFQDIRNTLAAMADIGVRQVECSDEHLKKALSWGMPKRPVLPRKNQSPPQEAKPPVKRQASATQNQPVQSRTPVVSQAMALEKLRQELGDCRRCNLGQRRQNIVYGAGNPDARLVFVGEAPGYDEDVQGQPFVGASGQLLTKMISAMGIRREDVYICNVLKCRPTDNRNPLPEEIVTCISYLKRQIEIIRPEVICTLGGFATQALLEKPDGITRLRGIFHDYQGIRVMPVFHPAYLLRNAEKKREAWADLQKIMSVLGLQRS